MLKQQREVLARHVALFQKEGEGRWESWTSSPSIHSPRVLVPSPLLLQIWSLSPPTLLPQTQRFRSFLPQSWELQHQPLPLPLPPLSSPLT